MRFAVTLAAAAAALAGAASSAAAAADLDGKAAAAAAAALNPFPSLRKKGDTTFTALHPLLANNKTDELSAVKAAASDKEHAVTSAIHDAVNPLGNKTMEAWISISNAQWAARNKTGPTACKPGAGKLKAGLSAKGEPLSFAFQGSGTLLPYYLGAVSALQDAGVITPEVAASAHFGGLSGGSVTSVFTAAGFKGSETLAMFKSFFVALQHCYDTIGQTDPRCSLFAVARPVFVNALRAKNPNTAEDISNRVTIWTCQVNTQTDNNKKSIPLGTSKWSSIEDVVNNIAASGSIPCFGIATQYTTYRGIGMIDGGYCADYAQLCPKTPSKCVKFSTTFLGKNLRGTYPTAENCRSVVPSNYLPYPDKPYYTPDPSQWTYREPAWPPNSTFCQDPQSAVAVPFVAQGVTAKPDIYPFFYSELPANIADGCAWQALALNPTEALAKIDTIYSVGYAAGTGWAKDQGYC